MHLYRVIGNEKKAKNLFGTGYSSNFIAKAKGQLKVGPTQLGGPAYFLAFHTLIGPDFNPSVNIMSDQVDCFTPP